LIEDVAKKATKEGFARGGGERVAWPQMPHGTIRKEEAIQKELEILERSPTGRGNDAKTQLELGLAILHQGRLQEALGCFVQAVNIDPRLGAAHRALGYSLGELGRYDEAEASLRTAARLCPGDASVLMALGAALRMCDKHEDSEIALRKCLDLTEPRRAPPAAWRTYAQVLHELHRDQEAEKAAAQAMEQDPLDAQARYVMGVVLKAQAFAAKQQRARKEAKELYEKAESLLRQALELDDHHVEAWNELGVLLQLQRRPNEAEAAFRRAAKLAPGNADAWLGLSRTLMDQDRDPEGQEALRHALQLDPQLHPKAHYQLACTWRPCREVWPHDLVRGVEKELALRTSMELDASTPGVTTEEAAAVRVSLGNFLKNEGRYAEARVPLEQAIRLVPSHPAATFNLEGVLNQLHEPEQAMQIHMDLSDRLNAEPGVVGDRWRRVDGPGHLQDYLRKGLQVDGVGL